MGRELTTLRHDIYQHPVIAAQKVSVHFTYVMLWHMADHDGRLLDNQRSIDGVVHHHRPSESCAPELEQLADLGLIIRYTSPEGYRLIQITDHARWFQVKTSKYLPSKFPPPSDYTAPAFEETANSPKKVRASKSGRSTDLVRTNSDVTPDEVRSVGVGVLVGEEVPVGEEADSRMKQAPSIGLPSSSLSLMQSHWQQHADKRGASDALRWALNSANKRGPVVPALNRALAEFTKRAGCPSDQAIGHTLASLRELHEKRKTPNFSDGTFTTFVDAKVKDLTAI